MIQLQDVSKVFRLESGEFTALKKSKLHINKGEFVAIMGPSGSGKSTLLQLVGGLDLPTFGNVLVDGYKINALSENERTLFRRKKIGFVFQNYQLLPMMTVAENIALPMAANDAPRTSINARVRELLKDVNLVEKEHQYPSQLSGGQQQRVAIARALAMKPAIILADEPTGNLDQKNGQDILRLLARLSKEENITIVMVTHDRNAAAYADRVITLRDGEITQDQYHKEEKRNELLANLLA